MDDTEVRTRLEEVGLTSDQIEEVLPLLISQPAVEAARERGLSASMTELQEQLDTETDWRKKASLAARMISLRLDY